MRYAILMLITAMTRVRAILNPPGTRLRDLPRRIRRELHWYFVVRPRVLRRPIAGGSLTDVTDGSRVIAEGIVPCQVVLSAAALPGDLLGKSGSTWVLADGNASVYAELVAGQKGASGDTITAFRIARVSALSGAAIGDPVYLSDTAGGYSASAGTVGQVVGVALSATEVLLFPNYITGGQLIDGALKLFFRDSGIYINSGADGKLTISADGAGTDDITLDGKVTINDDVILASGKVLDLTTADKLKCAGIIVPQRVIVTSPSLSAATTKVDEFIFIADRAYTIESIVCRASVLENSAADSTLMIEKVASGTAIGSGTDTMAAAVNLKTGLTANTNATLALHGTPANYTLAAGDALAADFAGTAVTEFVGQVTITLKAA